MVAAVEAAQKAARKAQERLYAGKCTITEYQKVKDEQTRLTRDVETVVLEDEPCRLSFETLHAAVRSESAAAVSQTVKLFISPEVSVPAGSRITVTQDGKTADYTCSGTPAVYPTHQEVMLELYEDYA